MQPIQFGNDFATQHPARRSFPEADQQEKRSLSTRQSLPASFTPSLPLYTLDQRRKSWDPAPLAEVTSAVVLP